MKNYYSPGGKLQTYIIEILFVLLTLLLGFDSSKAASLNGKYTINPSGTGYKNYTTFTKAVKALSDSGISGPVVFNISDGTYEENITINAIKGSSAKNTITFQSSSLDSSKVTLDSISSTSYHTRSYTVGFNGCSYIIFRKITISNIATSKLSHSYSDVVMLMSRANHITIENCRLVSNTGTYLTYGAIIRNLDTSNESYIIIRDNYIYGGGYGIQYGGSSNTTEFGNSITHNYITAFSTYGILLSSEDSLLVDKNTVFSTLAYAEGVEVYRITNRGLDTSRIINNFISVTNGGFGLYLEDNNTLDLLNNSIYVNTLSYPAAYIENFGLSADVRVLNNIFYNDSTGYSVSVMTGAATEMDYNDFSTDGSNIAVFNSSPISLLSTWQITTGFDVNSIVGKPYLKSVSQGDLHLTSQSLFDIHKGEAISSIVDDIDSELRPVIPSIGADDVPLIGNDLMPYRIDSPTVGFCSGIKTIYVTLRNMGNTPISSATVNWGVNGVARTAIVWKGLLKTGETALLKLDTVSFGIGSLYSIYIATHNPNGISDSFPLNDSTSEMIGASMSGTFTIGGTSPDFPTIRSATNILIKAGVCGPVIFNIRDGNYNETVSLTRVKGASELNTITFQSQSLDSSKVTIDSSWGSSTSAFSIRMDGASHFIFKELGISFSANHFGTAIHMINNCNWNIFSNNSISGIKDNDYDVILVGSNNNLFLNNYFSKSYDAIYFIKLSSVPFGNIIQGNTFDDVRWAIYCLDADSVVIRNNKILNSQNYGIYLTLDSTIMLRDTFLIDNNFINSQGECIHAEIRKAAIRFNSMFSSGAKFALEFRNVSFKTSSDILDNIIYDDGSGVPLSLTGSNIKSDHNDIFTKGSELVYSSTLGSFSDLTSWQKGSGLDAHSISTDPGFVNISKADFHIKKLSSSVARKGIFIPGYSFDIDLQRRPHIVCDIGADQFSFDNNDIGITDVLYQGVKKCEDSINTVPVQVSNLGLKPESGFKIYLSVTGPDTVTASYTYSGTLEVAMDTVILMQLPHKLNTHHSGIYRFLAYTNLANDTDRTSDTFVSRYGFRDGLISNLIFRTPSCAGDITFLYDSSKGNPKSYQWDFGDGSSSSKKNPLHVFVHPGKYAVSLKIRSASGCTDSNARVINVDSADARFSYIFNGSNVNFSPRISRLKYYRWDFGDGSVIDTAASPSHTFSSNVKYRVTLRVINLAGCMATYSDSVNAFYTVANEETKVPFSIAVYPNPFSNTTNINYSLDKATYINMEVYDVWGRRVATLLNNEQASGEHSIQFNPLDYNIRTTGILILKINAGAYSSRKTLIMVH